MYFRETHNGGLVAEDGNGVLVPNAQTKKASIERLLILSFVILEEAT